MTVSELLKTDDWIIADTDQRRVEVVVDAARKEAEKKRFVPPSIEEVTKHVKAYAYTFNPGAFHSHYESNGWKVGKVPMKNWKAACRTWHLNTKRNSFAAESFGTSDEKCMF